jgi:hypothetical protein
MEARVSQGPDKQVRLASTGAQQRYPTILLASSYVAGVSKSGPEDQLVIPSGLTFHMLSSEQPHLALAFLFHF